MLKPTQYVVGRAILNLAWAHVDVVVALWRFLGCRRVEFVSFVEPQVACISVNVLRIRRNKLPSARNVKLVSGAINNVGRDADNCVGSYVHLHAEMPGIPFFAAGHFRVALPAVVLCRARRFDEACVDDSPFTEPQACFADTFVDRLENLLANVVFFKLMPKLEDRRFVGRAIRHYQADKLACRDVFVEEILHLRITQVV